MLIAQYGILRPTSGGVMPDEEALPVELTQTGVDMTPPLDVKDAVRLAMEYFRELFGSPFVDLSLEEVQKNAQGIWIVTIGYTMARNTAAGIAAIPNYPRMYKQISVATTGEVVSMKVHKF
jgi:hypothetical protein